MKTMYDGIAAESSRQQQAQLAARVLNTKPSLPLEAYVGTYSHPFYGKREIQLINGKLRLLIGKDSSADLDHWQHDTFRGPWNDGWRGDTGVAFQVNAAKTEVEGVLVGGVVVKRQSKGAQ